MTDVNYASSALCFALAWDKYDVSNPDEPVYSLEILTAYEQGKMLLPNYPQDRYYTQKYTKESYTSYNSTDFMQIMSYASKVIVDRNTEGDAGQFSIMYTPMNSGDYLEIVEYDPVGPYVASVYEMFIFVAAIFLNSGSEPREDMITVIMKRLGV